MRSVSKIGALYKITVTPHYNNCLWNKFSEVEYLPPQLNTFGRPWSKYLLGLDTNSTRWSERGGTKNAISFVPNFDSYRREIGDQIFYGRIQKWDRQDELGNRKTEWDNKREIYAIFECYLQRRKFSERRQKGTVVKNENADQTEPAGNKDGHTNTDK